MVEFTRRIQQVSVSNTMLAGRKTILFGGSFDPIHNGHLGVAVAVREKLGAEKLVFVPARRSPHKEHTAAAGHHRIEMIRRAIADTVGFSVSDCELNRPEPSYTLQTVTFFKKEYGPETEFFWLIGADQLKDFEKWYGVTELLNLCRVSVMVRAGYPKPTFERFGGLFSPTQIAQLERDVVETPLIDISSTEIRKKLAAGILPMDQLATPVVNYIKEHHLYGYNG